MKLKVILTISLIFVINSLLGQSARYIITGIVKDADNGETLPFANVFLTGTTYGTVTDKDGNFELKIFEKGTYELIVKFIGYDTYAQRVEFLVPEDKGFEINLSPQSINLGAVVVTDKEDEEWQRNLDEFKRTFLGQTANAQKCKILNEQELNFYYNAENRTLEAFSSEPIKIRNSALGYTIDYYLEEFIIDYKNGFSRFFGFTQFKNTKEKNATKRRFVKSRNKAFYGSVEHFFRSLSNNQLKEEGWKVMHAEDVDGFGRAVSTTDYDVYAQVKEGPTEISKSLAFDGYLYVIYTKEFESDSFAPAAGIELEGVEPPKNPQRSYITIIEEGDQINFESSGYVLNPISFFSGEYWGYEKVADMLPTNYQPQKR